MAVNETLDFEDRKYVNPQRSLDEQNSFITKLRSLEQNNLQKIATDTHNLGTDVPSNLGGLSGIGTPNSIGISGADTGSAGIWRNRYERPQVNALVGDLKATAQAQALNDSLNNLLSQYKNRYNQAYRKAAKSSGNNNNTDDLLDDNPFDTIPSDTSWEVDNMYRNKAYRRFNDLIREGMRANDAAQKTYEEFFSGLGEDTSDWDGSAYFHRINELTGSISDPRK